jgi:hypothetical protein
MQEILPYEKIPRSDLGIFVFKTMDVIRPAEPDPLEFDRRLAAEHGNKHFNLSTLFVNLPDLAFEVFERSVDDDDRVVEYEVEPR